MRADVVREPTFAPAAEGLSAKVGDVEIAGWSRRGIEHQGSGTGFVMVVEPARVTVEQGTYPLPAGGYAVLPGPARIDGGRGLIVTARHHRGLFHLGGPVEHVGRLRYIDGCSDTVLVAPLVRGDPCLNLLCLPPVTVQTDHEHPTLRVGLVMSGMGSCVLADGRREVMKPGIAFLLPPCSTHRFETGHSTPLRVMAWHPDSDYGPTDDDHPMLNRTLRPGSSARVR